MSTRATLGDVRLYDAGELDGRIKERKRIVNELRHLARAHANTVIRDAMMAFARTIETEGQS